MGSELLGALLFASGMVVGRVLRVTRKRTYKPKTIKSVCGCQHHFSIHDPKTGVCHGGFDEWGSPTNFQKYSNSVCKCRQYSGPTPMPEFFAQEIGA